MGEAAFFMSDRQRIIAETYDFLKKALIRGKLG
jgi:hypothetical protein